MTTPSLDTRRCLLRLLLVTVMTVFSACSGPSGDASAKGKVTSSGPVGVFFMTRYWIAAHSLERAAWYFTSKGQVYENLEIGITDADLAAHKGRKGTFKLSGKELEVTWSDGKTTKGQFDPDKSGISFAWDTGLFTGAPPITDNKQVIGKFEGGNSITFGSGGISTSNTFEFRADGTYGRVGVASVKSSSKESVLTGGGESTSDGTWKTEAYSIILTGKDGTVTRKMAFPYFEKDTDPLPSRLFLGGLLIKRL